MTDFRICVLSFAFLLAACDDGDASFIDAGRDGGGDVDAVPAPAGMLPLVVDLAVTDCGASTQQTFTVMNTGSAELTYALALSDPAFTVTPSSGSIVAGASTTFTLAVTVPQAATAGSTLTATLTATTNLPGSPHSVPVRVTPRGAHITMTPPSVGIGQVEAGTTSLPSMVLVANTGNAPATVALAAPGGEFTRLFGTAGSIVLAGGQSASASFTYAPTALGSDSTASAVTVTGLHCGTAPTNLPITGTGAVTGGVLVQGTPVNFGAITCGATSATATVTLMNSALIAVPFTAGFLTDAENDHLRYTVVPTSGSVPASSMVQLTVTRLAIGLPMQPRAFDAVLRINTTIPTSTDTDVPVRQTLTGPFLTATPAATNFGYMSVGGTRTGPVSITNSGNAAATLQSSTAAPFALQLPAMVLGGASGVGTMTYSPAALGTTTGAATVDTPGACSSPVALAFTAGDGPLVSSLYSYGAGVTCPAPSTISGPIYVSNSGNQALDVTCVDTLTNDFAMAFAPSPLTVGAGSGAQIDVTVSTGTPIRSRDTSTIVRCTTNEPVGNLYDVTYRRLVYGSDLVLAAAAPLDLTCFTFTDPAYTITNAASSLSAEFVMPTDDLVFPLFHRFTQTSLAPGSSMTNTVESGPGSGLFHGGGDPCQTVANPGDIVFTGQVGVDSGSGTDVCSVTPSSLPVVLRAGIPPAE